MTGLGEDMKASCSVPSGQTPRCSLLSSSQWVQPGVKTLPVVTPLPGFLPFPNLLPLFPFRFLLEPLLHKSCSLNSLAHLKCMAHLKCIWGAAEKAIYLESSKLGFLPSLPCTSCAMPLLLCDLAVPPISSLNIGAS